MKPSLPCGAAEGACVGEFWACASWLSGLETSNATASLNFGPLPIEPAACPVPAANASVSVPTSATEITSARTRLPRRLARCIILPDPGRLGGDASLCLSAGAFKPGQRYREGVRHAALTWLVPALLALFVGVSGAARGADAVRRQRKRDAVTNRPRVRGRGFMLEARKGSGASLPARWGRPRKDHHEWEGDVSRSVASWPVLHHHDGFPSRLRGDAAGSSCPKRAHQHRQPHDRHRDAVAAIRSFLFVDQRPLRTAAGTSPTSWRAAATRNRRC